MVTQTGRHVESPEKKPCEKNANAQESFKLELEARLYQVITTLPELGGKPIRVWIEDEVRYGLITVARRVWSMKGIRVLAPYQAKYQASYLYGALEITQGQTQMLFRLPICLESTEIFLRELVATEPEAYHILLWDNA